MKICYVTGHYAPFAGGVETHVERIASHLAARGDEVTIMTQSDDASWPREETIEGVRVRRFAVPLTSRHFAVSPQLYRALGAMQSEWDVVHAHGYHSVAPLLAAVAHVRPLVFTPHYHGTGHSTFRKALHVPYRRIGSRVVAVASAIICVSEAERTLFETHFPAATTRTSVIPNGVDLERLLAAVPKPSDRRIIVSAGRLETYKHVDLTIRALSFLGDGYHLIVTGDGPDRARLERISAELGLGDRVTFLGRIDVADLYGWFRRAEVYVSMSTNEAMPVTILELLACGARVVASDIPAHRELHRRFGRLLTLVPSTTPPSILAIGIEAAAEAHPPAAPSVPSWTEVAAATRDVYQQVVVNG